MGRRGLTVVGVLAMAAAAESSSRVLRSWRNYFAGGAAVVGRRLQHRIAPTPLLEHPERPNLAVLIHGLQGNPADLMDHRARFVGTHAVYRPEVHRLGNCPLAAAVAPIRARIDAHVERHRPNGTVTLVGLSNGGRIASQIEVDLRGTPTPIFTATLAAPLLGSPLIETHLGWLAGATGWYSWGVIDDLRPAVAAAAPLTLDLLADIPEATGPRRWHRYAGEADAMVPVQSATHAGRGHAEVVPDHCHVSLATATADAVYASAAEWLENLPCPVP